MRTAIFDLGGVLLEYEPRRLYRTLFADPQQMEAFLTEVVTSDWNDRLDCGWSFAEGISNLVARHPAHEAEIRAFQDRWPEMIGDLLEPNVRLLEELKASGVRLYALSNWSAETWPLARPRFPFLDLFDGILISGEVGFGKPDPAFFRLLAERYGFHLGHSVFVDDNPRNVRAAARLGIQAVHYQGDPPRLRTQMREFYPFLAEDVCDARPSG